MSEAEALVTLNLLPGMGPVRIRRLISTLGSARNALTASSRDIERIEGIGPNTARLISDWENQANPESELAEAHKRGITIITSDCPSYPEPLSRIADSPIVLYVWGDLQERDRHALGIVGSRQLTHYGRQTARKFAFHLAQAGLTILSGLARGIDTAAHEGALAAQGRTVAVIGSGLLQLYPPENMPLAQKIANGGGAVISEYPLHTRPDRKRFPQRNRVVAGWGTGLLVVECPARSGALITANLATEYNRNVYAIPGQLDRPTSQGCNNLIREGATLVTDPTQILEDFSNLPLFPSKSNGSPEEIPVATNLKIDEKSVYEVMEPGEEHTIDSLIEASGLQPKTVSTVLLMLEMKHLVKALPGQRYVKL